ncbi:MAG: phospholipase [Caulobacteraceae bacterium]|nr:phospholipase [Caulobacteraceae bacterium]
MDQDETLLRPGETCWRLSAVDRAAFLIDGAEYFAAAKSAMLHAKRSIWLLAWVFDVLTRLTPDQNHKSRDPQHADRMGLLLRRISALRPVLDIRLLVWNMPPPIAASQIFAPQRGQAYFAGSRIKYCLDSTLPMSACQHQKVLVVDHRLAFLSGGDLGLDRWDTCDHADHDPRRRLPNGHHYPPRHEVTVMVEGPIAEDLGALFQGRWQTAVGETPPIEPVDEVLWPDQSPVHLRGGHCAIVRSGDQMGEGEALHLACIRAARFLIYIENQYLTSAVVVAALEQRLQEPAGPEIVVVGPSASPSFFDRLTMDGPRGLAVTRLRAADRFGHFEAYIARTAGDNAIIVHSKVMIIDDRLLRIGSANLNNRSAGLDSECDLAFEAPAGPDGAARRQAIAEFRSRLVGHFLGVEGEMVERAQADFGSLRDAITALDGEPRRLRRFEPALIGALSRFIAHWSLGDPVSRRDAWRPWRRRRCIKQKLAELV